MYLNFGGTSKESGNDSMSGHAEQTRPESKPYCLSISPLQASGEDKNKKLSQPQVAGGYKIPPASSMEYKYPRQNSIKEEGKANSTVGALQRQKTSNSQASTDKRNSLVSNVRVPQAIDVYKRMRTLQPAQKLLETATLQEGKHTEGQDTFSSTSKLKGKQKMKR